MTVLAKPSSNLPNRLCALNCWYHRCIKYKKGQLWELLELVALNIMTPLSLILVGLRQQSSIGPMMFHVLSWKGMNTSVDDNHFLQAASPIYVSTEEIDGSVLSWMSS